MPYMTITSPGSRTPTLVASAHASTVPAVTGSPCGRPVSRGGVGGDGADDLGRPGQLGQRQPGRHGGGPVAGPVQRVLVVHGVALARRVVVEHVAAGEPVDQVRARHQQHLGALVHLRLVPGEPADLGPDRLGGQRGAAAAQDLRGAQLCGQLGDLGARPGVDAVEDARAQRAARAVGGQQARPDPADREPGQAARRRPGRARGPAPGSRPTTPRPRRARPSPGAGWTCGARGSRAPRCGPAG